MSRPGTQCQNIFVGLLQKNIKNPDMTEPYPGRDYITVKT